PSSRLLLPRVVDRLRPALDDLQVQLEDVRRHRVPADRLLLPDPRARRMEPDAPADQEALPPRPRQVGPHREAVLVAPSSDLELVAGQADVQAVEVVAELLADQGVGVMPGDIPLVRFAVLRIRDDRLEFRQRAPTEGIRPCGASIKDFRRGLADAIIGDRRRGRGPDRTPDRRSRWPDLPPPRRPRTRRVPRSSVAATGRHLACSGHRPWHRGTPIASSPTTRRPFRRSRLPPRPWPTRSPRASPPPPPWMSRGAPRYLNAIALHSTCHPGRPGPQALGQDGSPSFDRFQRAKSSGSSFLPAWDMGSTTMSSTFRWDRIPKLCFAFLVRKYTSPSTA